jgi:hypothetical protein
MNHRHFLSALAVLSSLTIGCGGGATITCPDGKDAETIPGEDFVGIPDAEKGQVCLTRTPVTGFPFLGVYQYDDFGTRGEPVVRLWGEDDPEKSTFQAHGVTEREVNWGIAVHPDGRFIGPQTEHGAIVFLFYNFKEPGYYKCTPGLICDETNHTAITADVGKWQAAQLSVSFDMQQMYVYGERILECSGACDGFPYFWP